jgi:hypothetical protein
VLLLLAAASACSAGGAGNGHGGGSGGPALVTLSPAAEPAVIEWLRREPPEKVSVGPGGLWYGPPQGPRARYLFAPPERAADLALFARTYAPFRLAGAGAEGELDFRGRGAAAAGATERRMIGEWVRQVVADATGGTASPFGLVLAWHRGAGTGGVCDDLEIYGGGEVRASSCGHDEVTGRLAVDRLARLYDWEDRFAPFQAAGEEGPRADSLLARLIFAGRGRRAAAAADIAGIEALAETLHHEMTGAPGEAGAAPDATPERGTAAEQGAAPQRGTAPERGTVPD